MGETINERPEADALHSSANAPALRSPCSGTPRCRRMPEACARSRGRTAMARQVQRRPRVRRAVHEAMARDVIAWIEAVEIQAHASQFFGSVVGERTALLVPRAPRALIRQRFGKDAVRGQSAGARVDQGAKVAQAPDPHDHRSVRGVRFRRTERQASRS